MKEILVKLFVGFIFLILITIGIFKCTSKEYDERDKLLDNGIIFYGTIIYTKASYNHSYGIVRIKIDSSNVKEYSQLSDNYLFPYRIKDSIAEIYCTVPNHDEIKYGKTKVYINSDLRKLSFDTSKLQFNSSLYISTDDTNLRYVKKHTIFKD